VTSDSPQGRWASDPFETRQISDKHYVVISKITGKHATLDRNVISMLRICQTFRTIPDHVREIVRLSTSSAGDESELKGILLTLIEHGLFRSAETLIEPFRRQRTIEEPSPVPVRLVIATCDRPEVLSRLLDSLADNQARFGNEYAIDVVDDSRTEAARHTNATLVRNHQDRLDLSLIDRTSQQALVETLAQEFPEHQSSLRWLLEPRDDQDPDGGTYGLPMNHGILRGWGGKVLFIDDDAIVRAWRRKEDPHPPLTTLGRNPDRIHIYPDLDEALTECATLEEDPLALHARLLTSPAGRGVAQTAGTLGESLLADKTSDCLAGIDHRTGRVRATSNGILGDTGSVSDLWLLSSPSVQPHVAQWPSARYRRIRKADRVIHRGSGDYNFFPLDVLQKTTCLGLAIHPYMAPIAPAGRGEDSLIATLGRCLYPGDLALSLPFALEHRPFAPRKWNLDPASLGNAPTVPDLLRHAIEEIRPTIVETAPRLRALELAKRLGLAYQGSDGLLEVRKVSRSLRITALSSRYAALHAAFNASTANTAPNAWREDCGNALRGLIRRIAKDPDPISDEFAERMRSAILRYADALVAWDKATSWIESR